MRLRILNPYVPITFVFETMVSTKQGYMQGILLPSYGLHFSYLTCPRWLGRFIP